MTSTVSTAVTAETMMGRVAEFVALRRGLGYRSPTQERALRAFGRYLDQEGHRGPIRLESSLNWATSTTSADPCNPARRLTVVRASCVTWRPWMELPRSPIPGEVVPALVEIEVAVPRLTPALR